MNDMAPTANFSQMKQKLDMHKTYAMKAFSRT